jgi:hypothetical protein
LGDQNVLLLAAAVSIIRAASENPNYKRFVNLVSLDNAITYMLYTPDKKIEPELVRDAKIIYEELQGRVADLVIDRWNKS